MESNLLGQQTLLSSLRSAAERESGVTFVDSRTEQEFLSYKELYSHACTLLSQLQAAGAGQGDEVVFQIASNKDFLLAFWACLLGGLIPVPLAVGTNEEHRRKVFLVWQTLNNPFLLIDTRKSLSQLSRYAEANGEQDREAQIRDRLLILEEPSGTTDDPILLEANPDDIALIQFSSGSTGQPKGVIVTHRSAVVNTTDMVRRLAITEEDKFLSWMPLTHDFGIIGMHLTPLVAGIDQCQIPTSLFIRNPMLWLHKADEYRATVTASPNFGYRHFLKFFKPEAAAEWDLSCLRLIQNGAEPISPTLCHEFLDKLEPFGLNRHAMLPGYGLAEATLAVSYSLFEEIVPTITLDRNALGLGERISEVASSDTDAVDFVDVGYPVDSTEVRITDGNGTVLEEDVIGLIEIRGENVTRGYYNNPEATERTVSPDGWLNTGDLGFLRNGRIVITGRAKDIIFVGGINYYPHDVERIATELEELDVNKVVVCGLHNDSAETEEVACFLYYKRSLEDFIPLAEKVRDHIMRKVGIVFDYVLPVTAIPKTTSGKVQRFTLAQELRKGGFAETIRELEALERGRGEDVQQEATAEISDRNRAELKRQLRSLAETVTGEPVTDDTTPFADYGFDSVRAIEYRNRLAKMLGLDLPVSLMFDYANINELAEYISTLLLAGSTRNNTADGRGEGDSHEIAIIGIGCRFPGEVASYDDLVRMLTEERDTSGNAPSERWEEPESPWRGSFVGDVDCFDNTVFSITPKEAVDMDPQQRLLLETTWHALEHANINAEILRRSKTGVFVGISSNEYSRRWEALPDETSQYSLTGTMLSTAAGRISYTLGLGGPSMAIDTACSSSLVAVHLAVQSLRNGESNCAVAGGVNLILDAENFTALSRLGALAADGRCKTFGQEADGYGRGEGCGVILLKRLEDALRDGDTVYATVNGSAVNHDGRSNGLTAPSGTAQERVIRAALSDAQLDPADVRYVEAHGTGTALGDPQEISALQNVYGRGDREDKLVVGSVKSNIGHLESAAGIAGLIKTVATLRERKFFRSLHTESPSPYIAWRDISVEIARDAREWKSSRRRTAGVSAFGLSGTNAHIILGEYPLQFASDASSENEQDTPFILPLSAAHADALPGLAQAYAHVLDSQEFEDPARLRDLCGTAARHRTPFRYRSAVCGRTRQELQLALGRNTAHQPDTRGGVAWMFTGQGSQYEGMGRQLYEQYPVFRESVDTCSGLFRKWLGYSVKDAIYEENAADLNETLYTQPTIFTLEYALAQLWLKTGIRPDMVGGHSIGEFVAAVIAESLSLEDAVSLVAHRAQFMQELDRNGGMAAVFCSESRAATLLNGDPVSLAAINGPDSVVIAGETEALDKLIQRFGENGIPARRLKVSHAFHTPLMKAAAERFREVAQHIHYRTPAIPFVSALTGEILREDSAPDAEYWTQHILEPVRFANAVEAAVDQGIRTFLEVGAAPTLTSLGSRQTEGRGICWIPSLRKEQDDRTSFAAAVTELWNSGTSVDWTFFYPDGSFARTGNPLYPFLKNRFWLPRRRQQATEGTLHHIIESKNNGMESLPTPAVSSSKEDIAAFLTDAIEEKTGYSAHELPTDRDLFDIGLDSLVLIAVRQKIEHEYAVEIPHSLFYNGATVESLAEYVAENIPLKQHTNPAVSTNGTGNGHSYGPGIHETPRHNGQGALPHHNGNGQGRQQDAGSVEQIINRQLDLMAEQLRLLQGTTGQIPAGDNRQPGHSNGSAATKEGRDTKPAPVANTRKPFVPYRKILTEEEQESRKERDRFLENLIERYCALTSTSKERTDRFRAHLANNRNIAGFRPRWKELIYQLQVDRAAGSKVYDVDGNEYIDLTMGFGVYLFGHNPQFIREEIEAELRRGASVGPMTPLADAAAEKLAAITGIERAAFYNSGTEAIMVALRLARASTGRSKVVIFSGSYHGTFDGVLALQSGDSEKSVPLAPGVPQSMIEDIVVLPYNKEESLDYIRTHAHELAAVLAETVQSRRPDVQPQQFLQDLRTITQESGTALIFDEVITGFRIHPGGAQHHFGIRADIVTYGKVIGGGMPIGIVAGKREFLDAVDGGEWHFGDNSVPRKQNTFVAGTFCHHPLAMRATLAVLSRMETEGEQICSQLNNRTAIFAESLNRFFRQVNVPLKVVHFGSLFRFELGGDWELLYFLMMLNGIYVWEGRNCFFSTEHNDDDIERVRRGVVRSVVEMIQAGFAPEAALPNDLGALLEGKELADSAFVTTLPMSSVERRIYALSETAEGELAYHLNAGLLLEGEIDPENIQEAFRKIIARHEILRTGFDVEDEEFVRKIVPEIPFSLERGEAHEDNIAGTFREFVRPFDLQNPPLLRVGLFRLADKRHLLLLDIHHIVADGLSVAVIFNEFGALYRGESLPPVTTQYREVPRWEQEFAGSETFARQEAFWKDVLARETESLSLPVDRHREGSGSFRGGAVYLECEPEAVRRTAREQGCSIYMVLLASFNTLLHRTGGASDFRVGVVHAGRSDERFASTVGMFANSLLFPCSVAPDMTFRDLLKQTRDFALALYENFEYPFEQLAALDRRAVNDQRIGFSYERAFDRVLQVGGAKGEELFLERFTSISDFALDVVEERNRLLLRFDYSSDLFDRETVERLAGYFRNILQEITADPNRPIGEYALMDESEREYVLGNHTGGPALDSLPNAVALLERWAAQTPDAVALMQTHAQLSYTELNSRANGIAELLHNHHGVTDGKMVAVLAERSPEFIIAIVGIMKSGGGFLPIDPSLPDARIAYMLQDADVAAVLTTEKFTDRPALSGQNCIAIESVPEEKINPSFPIDGNSTAYMIYTSGSTGKPKGVMVSHHNLANYACWTSDVRIRDNGVEVVSLHTTPSFDMIIGQIIPPLVTGKALFLHDPSLGIDRIMEDVFSPDTPIDCAVLTPSHALLLEDMELDRTNVKVASIGGEALGEHHTAILWGLNPEMQIINDYGPTEATVTCIVHHVNRDGRVNVVGVPVMNTSVYILDDRLQPCPTGVTGEICIGGASVAIGYRNLPELTGQRFIENPFVEGDRLYRTGDLGRLLQDGTIEFFGRKDRQIKLFGNRIELDEIESALCSFDAVKSAAVKLIKNESRQILAAWISSADEIETDTLREKLALDLPHYMVPGVITRVEQLPLTPNGKIDFARLPDPVVQDAPKQAGGINSPETEAEKAVAAAWEAILNISDPGVLDNFYELGGDSIKAIRIASRLRKQGYDVEGGTIMKAGTIRSIASKIHDSVNSISQDPVHGTVELSPIQQWFFNRTIPNPHHWNQEVVLRSNGHIDESALHTAFSTIVAHHDALRTSYRPDGTAWNRQPGEEKDYRLDVAQVSDGELRDLATATHRKINIERGPLVSATLCRREEGDILIVTIHHLVVDAVSWTIIVEDLIAAYKAAHCGEPVSLPAKTASFRDHVAHLKTYSATEALTEELHWWESVETRGRSIPALKTDGVASVNTEAQTTTRTVALNEEQTGRFLEGTHHTYNTSTRELLTAALAIGMKEWTGETEHRIVLEGHGREQLGSGSATTDRTVGWFTTTFPFLLSAPGSIEDTIIRTKEELRSVPNNGIGYGLLHYFAPERNRGTLKFDLPTDILFNYLGNLDFNESVDDDFRVDIDPLGKTAADDAPRDERIALDCFIRDGRLHWTAFYNREEYTDENIGALCEALQAAVVAITDVCSGTDQTLTLSDLEYQGFRDREELLAFLERNTITPEDVENIRPLTPMQEGMLFNYLTDPKGSSGLVQLGLALRGTVDIGLLEQAFAYVLHHHDALRTGFAWDGGPEPLSIVYREIEPAFAVADQAMDSDLFLETDWNRGARLSDRSQMRMTVLRTEKDLFNVAWTVHHIVMDGWCIGIVFNTLLEAYDRLKSGEELSAIAGPSYGRYTQWLEGYDRNAGLAFWKEYLNGYSETAALPARKRVISEEKDQQNFSLHLDQKEISALEGLAASLRTTTNTLIRTAWSLVLSGTTGADDVVFGGVVSGRPAELEDVESTVGLFINTVPVRFRIASDESVATLVGKAHSNAMETEPYHYTPLTDIQSLSPLSTKLFDHILVFENYPLDQELANGLKNREDFSIETVAFRGDESFDLVLTVMLEHEREILFTYNNSRYTNATIENAAHTMRKVLSAMTENPDAVISTIIESTREQKKAGKSKKSLRSLKDMKATRESITE